MNEWWKRIREQLTGLWARWNTTQKVVLFSIIGASILAVILLFSFSATPSMVPLISNPITDSDARLQIAAKLDEMEKAGTLHHPGSTQLTYQAWMVCREGGDLFRELLVLGG